MEIHGKIKEKLNTFFKNNNVPHILLYGPYGSGKKTLLMEFIKTIYKDSVEYSQNVMYINCAVGKGIQFIREDIKQFAKSNVFSKNKFKSIILYNADRLTVDAQSALRRCIELFSVSTRFFMVVQSKQQLLRPILSRFCDIHVCYPIVKNKPYNLHILNKEHNTKYKNHIKYRTVALNKVLYGCYDNSVNLFDMTNILYNKGYSAYDIVNSSKCNTDVRMLFHTIKHYYKNERLLMMYILFLLFRSKENLEIFELIT